MINALNQYVKNSLSIKELGNIYELITTSFPLLDKQGEEILRAQIVLIVGALDCYIHDCVRIGLLHIFNGKRLETISTHTYQLNFKLLKDLESSQDINAKVVILESYIREKNSKESYQSPKSIEYALGLINVTKLWSQLSNSMEIPPNDIKDRLAMIVNRRNKIAHESDLNPLTGGKFPVDKKTVNDVISFIDKLAYSINQIVT